MVNSCDFGHMINWCRKSKLVRLVERLAVYNDKGIAWSKHNHQQVEDQRQRMLGLILCQINKLGEGRISNELLAALNSGSLKTDMTGRYVFYAKQTKL